MCAFVSLHILVFLLAIKKTCKFILENFVNVVYTILHHNKARNIYLFYFEWARLHYSKSNWIFNWIWTFLVLWSRTIVVHVQIDLNFPLSIYTFYISWINFSLFFFANLRYQILVIVSHDNYNFIIRHIECYITCFTLRVYCTAQQRQDKD